MLETSMPQYPSFLDAEKNVPFKELIATSESTEKYFGGCLIVLCTNTASWLAYGNIIRKRAHV